MENPSDLVALVAEMRAAQREYFKTRDRDVLQRSKELERAVDAMIDRRAAPDMFSDDLTGKAEPVAWQHRFRSVDDGEWTEWNPGPAPELRGTSYEVECRPLYTAPPAPQVPDVYTAKLEAGE